LREGVIAKIHPHPHALVQQQLAGGRVEPQRMQDQTLLGLTSVNPIVAKKGLKIVNKEVKKACGSPWNMV
jgi:hypothetical protein